MSGTIDGGKKAALTNKAKYGKDFYARIGKKGGLNGNTGGFASNPDLAKIAGSLGGMTSKRGIKKYYFKRRLLGTFKTTKEAFLSLKDSFKDIKINSNGKLLIDGNEVKTRLV